MSCVKNNKSWTLKVVQFLCSILDRIELIYLIIRFMIDFLLFFDAKLYLIFHSP